MFLTSPDSKLTKECCLVLRW